MCRARLNNRVSWGSAIEGTLRIRHLILQFAEPCPTDCVGLCALLRVTCFRHKFIWKSVLILCFLLYPRVVSPSSS